MTSFFVFLLAVAPVAPVVKLDLGNNGGQVQMTFACAHHAAVDSSDLHSGYCHFVIVIQPNHHRFPFLATGPWDAGGAVESNPGWAGTFPSFFVMNPTLTKMYEGAYVPWSKGQIDEMQAVDKGSAPLKLFMLKSTRQQDLKLFVDMAGGAKPKSTDDLSMRTVVPAFMISELKTAFQIGFVLFLPFLVIDMVVSSVLLPMGMMQLPPAIVSLPFKVLLFIMVDSWSLIVTSLVKSYA
jgi:flagellar biosynthetic protein FliP